MREFRVWCHNKNEWEEHECFISQNGVLYQRTNTGAFVISPKNHTVEFYTGLKDKNGKEIFEGDKCKVTNVLGHVFICAVLFNDGCFELVCDYFRDYLKCYVVNHAVEIIGTIHDKKGDE